MRAVSSLSGVWGELQPKSNLVHFSFKICHPVAAISMTFVRNIGRAKCIVRPTNPTVGGATALRADYVSAPLLYTASELTGIVRLPCIVLTAASASA